MLQKEGCHSWISALGHRKANGRRVARGSGRSKRPTEVYRGGASTTGFLLNVRICMSEHGTSTLGGSLTRRTSR
jgi:hypothetical protein